METELDDGQGQKVGSRIGLSGRVGGVALTLEEMITERQVPSRKGWETIGTRVLLIIAHYRMGFELTAKGDAAQVRVFIDYSLPTHAPEFWFGRLLGGVYARWCTKKMADDAARHFEPATAESV